MLERVEKLRGELLKEANKRVVLKMKAKQYLTFVIILVSVLVVYEIFIFSYFEEQEARIVYSIPAIIICIFCLPMPKILELSPFGKINQTEVKNEFAKLVPEKIKDSQGKISKNFLFLKELEKELQS